MSWTSRIEARDAGRIQHGVVAGDGGDLCFGEVLHRWRTDATFRSFFIELLRSCPFPAYFWETPPITRDRVDRGFEFVLVENTVLARMSPDESAFAEHFARVTKDDWVVSFANLGGDAQLIAPCPRGPPETYPHLAAFTREAPEAQQQALWQAVGTSVERALGAEPRWLSTAGSGVAWLHVRLDTWPKYYSHAAYRRAP